jgi:hypothetical protein
MGHRRTLGPEVLIREIERRALRVGEREDETLDWQSTGLHRPTRETLPPELLAHLVLVEVEERVHAVTREQRHRPRDGTDVPVVKDAGPGLYGPVDDAEAHDVEPVLGQGQGGRRAEPCRDRRVWRPLVDHVQPMEDLDASLGVDDPSPDMPEHGCRRGRRRARRGARGARHLHHRRHGHRDNDCGDDVPQPAWAIRARPAGPPTPMSVPTVTRWS